MAVATCRRVLPADRIVTDPARLRWGIVSTVKAPLRDIARFAAWHLHLGAARIHIHLDAPDPKTHSYLSANARVVITACDDAYWQGKPEKARSTHQLRQVFNASRTYRTSDLDWLAHLDVDEFLLSDTPVAQMLTEAPPDCACLRLPPAEQLAHDGPTTLFKRSARAAGQSDSVTAALYPTFGATLPQGFLSYTTHKMIARTGLGPLRFGIHQLTDNGVRIDNAFTPDAVHIGHAHAPDFERFLKHMTYRLTRGSYRDQANGNRRLHAILSLLTAEPGSTGLRRFYDEVCTARPDLLDKLRAHDMLLSMDMNLDRLVGDHFGPLPVAHEVPQ